MNGLVIKVYLRQVVHVVMQLRLYDVVGEHGVEHFAFQPYIILCQHLIVVFQVLSYLQYLLVLIDRLEYLHNFPCLLLVSRHGNVKSLVFLHCKAQSHQFCFHCVD